MIFLLAGLAVTAGIGVSLFAPDVKTLRPEIESFLKQELKLKQVELGKLSWYWIGHFGIKADASSFASHDGGVAIRKSDVTVNISMLDLLVGKVVPAGLNLSGGEIDLVLRSDVTPQSMPIPTTVSLKDMKLKWRFGDYVDELEHFTASFDSEERYLTMRIPGATLEAAFNDQLLPDEAEAEFSDMSWLPTQWDGLFSGLVAGKVRVKRQKDDGWSAEVQLNATASAPGALHFPNATWPFDALSVALTARGGAGAAISRIEARHIEYISGKNHIKATALWQNSELQLSASAPYLQMPMIWQGLKPLGKTSWHRWLASMKHGVASEVRAELAMKWPTPWQAWPAASDLKEVTYHVNGHMQDADIALGLHDDFLTKTEADVELDQHGLKAIVVSAELPHQIGTAHGGVTIPWSSLLLDVQAKGEVDAGKLHTRLQEAFAKELQWGESRAEAEVSLQWMPLEKLPRAASIKLKPLEPWALEVKETPVQVKSGEVVWELGDRLKFNKLLWSTPFFVAEMDMEAFRGDDQLWQVVSMSSMARGDLATITTYFLLPIKTADGQFSVSLNYDEGWHGVIGLKGAGWENLLGTQKRVGEPLDISFAGANGKKEGQRIVVINDIHCDDTILKLKGVGEVSDDGVFLNFDRIESPAFAGAIEILAPFGSDPWELSVNASYLNRKALPDVLARGRDMTKKHWALRANLDRFVWNEAEIKGVSIKLASALNSIAVMKAASFQSGDLGLTNLLTIFSMPGGGVIDLRSLQAEMEGLQLMLSATLSPNASGGGSWRGFAQLSGDFGHMMKRAELSNLFEAGDMRVLFSGKGELFSDQPWWQGLDGRLRMRVDRGRLMKGGTMSKFLAAISLADLPALFFGSREDLTKPGLGYKRLQVEATMQGKDVDVHKVAMRASAMDIAGKGVVDMDSAHIDLTLVIRPLQNLDAILSKIPLIRDMFGGAAHSLLRKVYRMHGPISDAVVEQVSPEEAGLAAPGMIESLLSLPENWFGKEKVASTP